MKPENLQYCAKQYELKTAYEVLLEKTSVNDLVTLSFHRMGIGIRGPTPLELSEKEAELMRTLIGARIKECEDNLLRHGVQF